LEEKAELENGKNSQFGQERSTCKIKAEEDVVAKESSTITKNSSTFTGTI
jgi:hypothetical protein